MNVNMNSIDRSESPLLLNIDLATTAIGLNVDESETNFNDFERNKEMHDIRAKLVLSPLNDQF